MAGGKSIVKQTAANVAADLLRETGNPAIGWGDSALLHGVAERLGMEHESARTERLVLNRIDRTHKGVLVKTYIRYPERGLANTRCFYLPDAWAEFQKTKGKRA